MCVRDKNVTCSSRELIIIITSCNFLASRVTSEYCTLYSVDYNIHAINWWYLFDYYQSIDRIRRRPFSFLTRGRPTNCTNRVVRRPFLRCYVTVSANWSAVVIRDFCTSSIRSRRRPTRSPLLLNPFSRRSATFWPPLRIEAHHIRILSIVSRLTSAVLVALLVELINRRRRRRQITMEANKTNNNNSSSSSSRQGGLLLFHLIYPFLISKSNTASSRYWERGNHLANNPVPALPCPALLRPWERLRSAGTGMKCNLSYSFSFCINSNLISSWLKRWVSCTWRPTCCTVTSHRLRSSSVVVALGNWLDLNSQVKKFEI